MKKRIIKLIALSMLPMTLMSFKGNERLRQVDGNKIVGRINKAGNENPLRKEWGSYIWDSQNNNQQAYNGSLFNLDVSFQPTEENNFNYVYLYIPLFSVLQSPDENLAEMSQDFSLSTYDMRLLPEGGAEPVYSDKRFYIVSHDARNEADFWVINPKYSKYVSFYGMVDEVSDMSQNCGVKIDITAFYKEILNADYFGTGAKDFTGLTVVHSANHSESPDESKYIADEDGNKIDYEALPAPYYEGEYHLNSGEKKDVYVNVDNPTTLDQIKTGIHAKDLFGADVPVEYAVKEGSSEYNPSKLGTYSYALTATDSYGQTATATLNINVVDTTGPVISEEQALRIGYSKKLTYEMLKNHFKITDNGSSKGGSIGEPSFFIGETEVTMDSPYSLNSDMAKAKTLSVKVSVVDSSANKSEKTFAINVLDDVAPSLNWKDEKPTDSTITIGLSNSLTYTTSDLTKLFSANDEVDGDISSKISVKENVRFNKVGRYEFTITANDSAGNSAELPVIVNVIQDIPPVFIISNSLVMADKSHPLSSADVENLVINGIFKEKYVNRNSPDFFVACSDYLNHSKVESDYSINYSVPFQEKESSGEVTGEQKVATGSLTIRVKDSLTSENSKETIWNSIIDFHSRNPWIYWVYGTLGLALVFMIAFALLKRR